MVARDENGQEVKRGVYVTAMLADEVGRKYRQGVYVDDNGDGTIQVQGQLELYHCRPDVTVVPDHNLRSDTREWVETLREQNELDYRWQKGEVQ